MEIVMENQNVKIFQFILSKSLSIISINRIDHVYYYIIAKKIDNIEFKISDRICNFG